LELRIFEEFVLVSPVSGKLETLGNPVKGQVFFTRRAMLIGGFP
jgi:hypothetical protein